MSNSVNDLLNQIKEMKLGDIAELLKAFEEEFGPVTMGAAPAAAQENTASAQAEQTEFNVMLGNDKGQKISIIKEVRAITGLGLKEAKDLVESDNGIVKEKISKDQAEELVKKLQAAGASEAKYI